MNKRQQLKLEDMEEEIDSLKKEFKTKKRGRPIMTKKEIQKWQAYWDDKEIEIPTTKELGMHRGMPIQTVDKISWALLAFAVAILISLVIKNV